MSAALQLGFNRDALPEAQSIHARGVGFLTLMVFPKKEKPISYPFKADRLPEIVKYLDKKRDSYLSQGEFFRPNRRLVNLWRIPVCFADLDIYHSRFAGLSPDAIARDIRTCLAFRGVPAPSFIIHSGRGVYVKWPYCAMYNLTQGRYVAPFVILTLQGLTLELKEGNNGRVHHGTTIQAGVFTIHL